MAVGALVAITLQARPAQAQSADDKAAAEALFDEGKKLFLAKKFADACPRLETSQKLDPGIGTLLYLADCYEGMGRVASAWATFREAAGAARTAGQLERERVARARATMLEPKIHKLTIAVGTPDVAGLEVKRNDLVVKREVWGAALPVDAGTYRLSVSAPGKKTLSIDVKVPEGAGAQTVTIPALEDAPIVAPPVKPAEAPVKPPEPPPPPPPPSGMGTQRIAGLAVGGAGVLALALGATFGGLAISANGDAKTKCPQTQCSDADGVAASTRAGTFADASTGLFVAGGAAAAAGLIVFLTAPSTKAEPSPSLSPAKEKAWLTPVFGGFGGFGSFAGLSAGRTW